MTKEKKKKVDRMVEDYITNQCITPIPRRYIDHNETRKLVRNRKLYMAKIAPEEFKIKLTPKISKISTDYTLANLPIQIERKNMQAYHFLFDDKQLAEMIKTPKIIVDRWYSTFSTSDGTFVRTSFYAVAPRISAESGLPNIYRFSIAKNVKNPEHYSISLYGIVGGYEDGWLFLARLDNSNIGPHTYCVEEIDKDFTKKHNAVLTKGNTLAQQRMLAKFNCSKKSNNETLMYCIPFPHIHLANPSYEIGFKPEQIEPKFLRSKVDYSLEQNISLMLNKFSIYDKLHLRSQDDYLVHIMRQEKSISTLSSRPKADEIIAEVHKAEDWARKQPNSEVNNPSQRKYDDDNKKEHFVYRSNNCQTKARQMY